MAVLEMSQRRREQPRETTGAGLRTIGGPREFSTFAILMLCFAFSVSLVVHREHREVDGAVLKPAAATHPIAAPIPRPDSPVSSHGASLGRVALSNDDAAALGAVAGNLVNSAADGVDMVVASVWDAALWLSKQIVGFVADSWVDPVTGDRLILKAAPDAFNFAASILALAMVAIVTVSLAGPLYAGWKSWRHVFRYR
jgi:hypothetical protein